MGLFNFKNDSSKNHINSHEYEILFKRISELSSDIQACKTNFNILETDISNLRGKFNQRLKGLIAEEPEKKKEESETINNGDLVAFG